MPVTYADVWEFWLRYREVAAAVDFITIHILPYWEDFPIPARDAARHVDAIRKQVVAAFPDKEIFLGEFGWPSAGRMREGALPSPANQARAAAGGAGAGQARELPRQPDRGLRPALEAPARRHRRRPLGPVRRLSAPAQIRLGRGRSPTIRTGAGRRRAASASRRSCSRAALAARRRATPPPRGAVWLRDRGDARSCRGTLIGWTHRERAARKPHRRRLAALRWPGPRSRCWRRSPAPRRWRRGRDPELRARARPAAPSAPREPLALALGAAPDRADRAGACRRRSASCSIRAIAIFRSRR